MQVDSIKPELKAQHAWLHRLKLKCDEPVADFAFEFNLRRYAEGGGEAMWSQGFGLVSDAGDSGTPLGSAGRSPQADVGLALHTSVLHFKSNDQKPFPPHSFQSSRRTTLRRHVVWSPSPDDQVLCL